jgi:CheY-like chemotaxis protein
VSRILAVDDEPHILKLVSFSLRAQGFDVLEASDGLAAVEIAEKEQPDLILLDVMMPVLDGYEACRRIRADACGKAAMIVALTGWGQEADRQRSRDAGFDHHLVKPVEFDALEAVLAANRN